MTLTLQASPYFSADFELQVAWYVEHATEHVARRYSDAVAQTIANLCENPGLDARCEFRHP